MTENIPGFTALSAITPIYGRARTVDQRRSDSIVAQMRIGGGLGPGGPIRSGFWSCAACVFFCSLLTGDPEGCLVACQASGACTVLAFSPRATMY